MNNELLAVLEYMERERGIKRETLLCAVESALLSAARKSIITARDVRVEIDRKTLEIRALARMKVVEEVHDSFNEVDVVHARRQSRTAMLGSYVDVEVTPSNFGRIAAQTAKQAIIHKIRMAEKERIYDEFRGCEGDIISGTVRRFDRGDVVVDLGGADGVIPSKLRVPTEEYQVDDRIRAFVLKVDNTSSGADILLSRSHPDFVRRLFELEVSEINDGTVEIKGIAREPGFRSKIAVQSNDDKVDPVGACVGLRGTRVKNVVRELSGEKIDIVRWHPDVKVFVANALAPAKLRGVEVDEDTHCVTVIVADDQLSLAIGKKGQNARLTSKLTGWKVDIQKEPTGDFEELLANAIKALAHVDGISLEQAERLVMGGFATVDGILAAEPEDIAALDGFNQEAAEQVQAAAKRA